MNWFQLFTSLHGRIPRRHFWTGVIAIVIFQLAVQIPLMSRFSIDLDKSIPPLWFRNVSLFLDVICAWPLFAVLAKRQEDRDQTPHLSWCFIALLLLFSVLEAFALTQDSGQYTPLGWAIGLPLLGVIAIVIFELGSRPGTPGPNRFGPEPM